jgi:HEAT repeat protein
MVCKRLLLCSLIAFAGCGGVAAIKPDPQMDQSQQLAQAAKNLSSEDPVQRGIAIATLGAAGPAAKSYVADLKRLENDRDPNVQNLAKDAIKKIEKGS